MIQIAPHMRILVAVEAVDFRKGIDGLVRVCKEALAAFLRLFVRFSQSPKDGH
jgi:hypothetical protein